MTASGIGSLLAVVDSGLEPAGVVVGAASFQVLRPMGCWGWRTPVDGALAYPTYEQGQLDVWSTAITRLKREASRLRAHGVAGVTVKHEWQTGPPPTLIVQLVGSAVRAPGVKPLETPFVSMLSMDETLKLLLRGWVPCGIAVGVSAIHVHGWGTSSFWQGNALTNAEMVAPTAAVQLARARAERALRRALRATHAEGGIGASVELTYESDACQRTGGAGSGQNGLRVEGRMAATGVVRFRKPSVRLEGAVNLSGVTA